MSKKGGAGRYSKRGNGSKEKLVNGKQAKSVSQDNEKISKNDEKAKCCILSRYFTSKDFFKDYIAPLLWAIVLSFVIRIFLYEPFRIPSGSMKPTFIEGDYIIVAKYSYGYGKYSLPLVDLNIEKRIFAKVPKRGDIVIFRTGNPEDKKTYIKRLIGLGGDEIRLSHGNVYLNGKLIQKKYVGVFDNCGDKYHTLSCAEYKEVMLEGRSYDVLEAEGGFQSSFPHTTDVYRVPDKHYFFMGDNRDHSMDSRYLDRIGFISEENIIGRAEVILWNTQVNIAENFRAIWNRSRLFKSLYDDGNDPN